jgi:lauroyl/myristoyl acyltransferase
LKDERSGWFFSGLRRAERRLPVERLYSLLKPFALARATLNTAFKNPRPCVPLPECLEAPWSWRLARQRRMSDYLNRYLEYFPERLAEPKWKGQCLMVGGGELLKAWQGGRPAVLAFCHFGPIHLLRAWVRAGGIPGAALVVGKAENRPELIRKTDRLVQYPHIPTRFYLDELKAAVEFLAAGNVLFIAIDGAAGRQIEVPFCEGWTFQMATGAMRLAIRHQAELIPCSIVEEGPWRFRIELGEPAPKEFLTAESEGRRAGEYLLAAMLPRFQAHPEQCGRELMLRLRKNGSAAPPGRSNS